MKYIKRRLEIEAVQWTGYNLQEIKDFTGNDANVKYTETKEGVVADLYIHTLEGDMHASKGDYIIRGIRGEYYPCKPEIFEMTYEEVNND